MTQVPNWLKTFSCAVTLIIGVIMFGISPADNLHPVQLFIFLSVLLGTAMVLLGKDFGRKVVRAASAVGIGYSAFAQICVLRRLDLSSIILMLFLGVVFFVLRVKTGRSVFRTAPVVMYNWTILVVDDDLTFLKLVKTHFFKKGVTVLTAETGERGLEMAKRSKPDLIILDVMLPGMKGRAVCAKLKEDPATEKIPVMFVTFKNSLDDISTEMELGAVMHLTKPVKYDDLFDQIVKVLSRA